MEGTKVVRYIESGRVTGRAFSVEMSEFIYSLLILTLVGSSVIGGYNNSRKGIAEDKMAGEQILDRTSTSETEVRTLHYPKELILVCDTYSRRFADTHTGQCCDHIRHHPNASDESILQSHCQSVVNFNPM